MKPRKKLNVKRGRRAARVGMRVRGTASRPRLAVSRSNRYLYGQLIDDAKGVTLAAVWSRAGNGAAATGKTSKSDRAFAAGEALARKAGELGIASAVFDRRAAKFHGRVKRFAEGARKGGLKL
jgi:large subunit ribosomal protein L18